MTLVAWQTEFETGVRSVDFEHQEMVALLNQLHGELCRDPDSDSLEGFLGEVFANISAHFALEEKIMRDMAYDDLQPHKKNHEELLDSIRDIMDHHHGGDYVGAPQLLADLLKDWFEEHFRGYDARLGLLTE